MLLSDDTEQKKTIGDEENTWRWMLFVACILLGDEASELSIDEDGHSFFPFFRRHPPIRSSSD
jgi:hypothetical protein